MQFEQRQYQAELKAKIYHAWNELQKRNVLAVLPTGGGKTQVFASIVAEFCAQGLNCAVIAHRNELVAQMSTTIASRGVYHRVIGNNTLMPKVISRHRRKVGKSYIKPSAITAVVGVDTLIARNEEFVEWAKQIDLWVMDECHHTIKDNKWGNAVSMFKNACGLGVTATPERTDGQGLGSHVDGVFDYMVEGPSMRWLIDQGYLADYDIVCPESDMHVDEDKISASGDWSNKTLRQAAKQSKIVGDVAKNYILHASGRKAIVFATDVETATEITEQFTNLGIKAACVHGKSDDKWRDQSLELFENGDLMVLVNVDLFDEGLDIQGAEVCIMARPTASLIKYMQSIGRVLRPRAGKVARIIDHVSNVIRHKLPDKHRVWTLDRKQKKAKQKKDPDEIPLTVCKSCRKPYEAFRTACPWCGSVKPLPEQGSRTIEMVEGDLILLDRETLAKMRAETLLESPQSVAERVAAAAGSIAGRGAGNRQYEKVEAHKELAETIAVWAALERNRGFTDQEIHRRFYMTLGCDVLTALSASKTRQEMETLTETIKGFYT